MFKHYSEVADLLSDDSFLAWHFKTDPLQVQQWDQWIAGHPESRELVKLAVSALDLLRMQEKELPDGQITLAESLLLQKVHELEDGEVESALVFSKPPVVRFSKRMRWMAAASVLFLVVAAYGSYRWLSPNPEVKTTYGEVKGQQLPDGTEVMVNADSRIVYSADWKDGKDREVWVNGEAYFHVRKTPMKSRFIVHTNHFDIIVTGTQFNVVNRGDRTNVMLKEGSIILHMGNGKDLKMVPGDFVEYNTAQLEKKSVKSDSVLAWRDHLLVFDNTPLRELVRIIKEHYGVNVILAGDSTSYKTITGMMPNDNLDVLLQTLEATTDFEIVRDGDTITIKNH